MVGTALLFGVDWGNLWLSGLVLVFFCAVSAAAAMMIGSVMDNDTAAAGVGGGLVLGGRAPAAKSQPGPLTAGAAA